MNNLKLIVNNRVGVLMLSRPSASNALNGEMLAELQTAVAQIDLNPAIDVLIITGEGRCFGAGGDIAEMQPLGAPQGKNFCNAGNRALLALENMQKPTICAVNGLALGGACSLALCCDIRIASENAKFGQPGVSLGILSGLSGTQRLPRTVGVGRAAEQLLTTRIINAAEAREIGLVNAVYPPEILMEKAQEMACQIAAQAQIAVRQAKRAVRMGAQTDIATALALESEAFGICFSTADQKEGMTAFLEKREKHFTGK